MNYISTKQLRQIFPEVRAALARGEEYVLIHRSQPIAKLVPLDKRNLDESSQAAPDPHITTHLLHKPMTLPTPAGYSHPVAFRHLKLDLKETVHLVKPTKVL